MISYDRKRLMIENLLIAVLRAAAGYHYDGRHGHVPAHDREGESAAERRTVRSCKHGVFDRIGVGRCWRLRTAVFQRFILRQFQREREATLREFARNGIIGDPAAESGAYGFAFE